MQKYLTQFYPRYLMVTLVSALSSMIPTYAQSGPCQNLPPSYTLGAETVDLPCVEVLSDDSTSRHVYDLKLKYLGIDKDSGMAQLAWDNTTPPIKVETPGDQVGAFFKPASRELYIPRITILIHDFGMPTYQVTLSQDSISGIFTVVKDKLKLANSPPVAKDVVRGINPAAAFQMIDVTATDNDWDSLTLDLVSPSRGAGYTFAYLSSAIDSWTNIATLYVMVEGEVKEPINLIYRAYDGKDFSEPAKVTLNPASQSASREYGLGSKRAGAKFKPLPPKAGSGQGGASAPKKLPDSVDLSPAFPPVGDQGKQNSCVGWSVAAVKSFQERVKKWGATADSATVSAEADWYKHWVNDMRRLATPIWPNREQFSPAFIYHKINAGQDNGAIISEALDLVVKTGAATLATMPYDENDVNSEPPSNTNNEVGTYRAKEWYSLVSTDEVKEQLNQGHPVIISLALHESFKQLQGAGVRYDTTGIENKKPLGEHAMVIVGYDNAKYDGAFKVRNSWGPQWGDDGYFWLTYNDFSQETVPVLTDDGRREPGYLVSAAYVLIDENQKKEKSVRPTATPEVSSDQLPDLQVADWDFKPDHLTIDTADQIGQLSYTIVNNGGGEKLVSLNEVVVALILSRYHAVDLVKLRETHDGDIAKIVDEESDIFFLMGEPIWTETGVEISQGQRFSKDSEMGVPLSGIAPGDYYLILMVDYDNQVLESNDRNNISLVEKPVTVVLPPYNLEIVYANTNLQYYPEGNSQLDYLVINSGRETIKAGIGWDLQLILVSSALEGMEEESKRVVLWQQQVTEALPPHDIQEVLQKSHEGPESLKTLGLSPPFYVPADAPVSFNVFHDVNGQKVPVGNYDLLLLVNANSRIEESAADDFRWLSPVGIKDHYYPLNPLDVKSPSETRRHTRHGQMLQQLRISETPEGQRRVEVLE